MQVRGDGCIVNCVSPHPSLPLLAVAGIDSDVKIFSLGDAPRKVGKRRLSPNAKAHEHDLMCPARPAAVSAARRL